nr:hypothetical protein [Marinobacterium stanieri]
MTQHLPYAVVLSEPDGWLAVGFMTFIEHAKAFDLDSLILGDSGHYNVAERPQGLVSLVLCHLYLEGQSFSQVLKGDDTRILTVLSHHASYNFAISRGIACH